MQLAFAHEVRELDRLSIETYGVPGVVLMENAGRATAVLVDERLPDLGRVGIFCGAGNNGGDGYVIARHLVGRGHLVDVFLLGPPERIVGDARTNLDILIAMGNSVCITDLAQTNDDEFAEALDAVRGVQWNLLVDALLGTGLSSPVRGRYLQIVQLMNEDPAPTVAVDIPSGLSADTGQPLGTCVRAAITATYGLAKPGLLLMPGRELSGDVHVIDIGFPANVYEQAPLLGEVLTAEEAAHHIHPRARSAHKGTCGHVLVIAGAPGAPGAAVMAGAGALRSGAGLVTVGTDAAVMHIIPSVQWELMSRDVVQRPFTDASRDNLAAHLDRKSVVAIGPGLGLGTDVTQLMIALVELWVGPLVIDADGLNTLANHPPLLSAIRGRAVLTPHPGEMARLLGVSVPEVLHDPLAATRAFAREHDVIVVLKTASTIVAHPDGRYAINTSGTPGMASAGMGDVLTGVISGFMAQGLSSWDASTVGVFVHGAAGEAAAEETGERGLLAGDLLDALPGVLRDLENQSDEPTTP